MNGFGAWFRQFTMKIAYGFRRFMEGRYGTDRLNMTILMMGFGMSILSMFFRIPAINLVLTGLSYALMFWAIARSLSRNTYKRYVNILGAISPVKAPCSSKCMFCAPILKLSP